MRPFHFWIVADLVLLPEPELVSGDIHRFVTSDGLVIPYTDPTMAIDDPLVIERREGKSPDTLIFQLTGPVTLRNLFELQDQLRSGAQPKLAILGLSGVPYMDSAGMGAIINYYVHCQNKGVKLMIAGVSSRVMELFKMTRVDTVMTFASGIEQAEGAL
ncbi:MAG TPA: STAS domain-containing protein [Terracidiphilus sp.]